MQKNGIPLDKYTSSMTRCMSEYSLKKMRDLSPRASVAKAPGTFFRGIADQVRNDVFSA
jgi:hypothetical protein